MQTKKRKKEREWNEENDRAKIERKKSETPDRWRDRAINACA